MRSTFFQFLFVSALLNGQLGAQEAMLTRCIEVQALPREKAARGLPVTVRGVVTFAFAGPQNSFVVDDGRGVFVAWTEANKTLPHPPETGGRDRFEVGMLVEIRGVTGRGRFAAVIVPQEIKAVGTAPLPPFRPMSVSAMRSGSMDCQCVEMWPAWCSARWRGTRRTPTRRISSRWWRRTGASWWSPGTRRSTSWRRSSMRR